MATRDDVMNAIKSWRETDLQIKAYNARLRDLRKARQQYADVLLQIMSENEVDGFELDNNRIHRSKRSVRAPLSRKRLTSALATYFEDDNSVASDEVVQFVISTLEKKECLIIKESGGGRK